MLQEALFETGQKVDDYRLERPLGGGQDGEVWQAERISIGRVCAIKFLKTATDSEKTARFLREIEILSGLNHPNIVSILDTGRGWSSTTKDVVPYYVMEFVAGKPIKDAIQEVREEERLEALCILFQQVLLALRTAHYRGVCHGDVKSGNILVLAEPLTAKLGDFGFALLAGQDRNRDDYPSSSHKAPEALTPKQADLFRTGMTLSDCVKYLPESIPSKQRKDLLSLVKGLKATPPELTIDDAVRRLKELQVIAALHFMRVKPPVRESLTESNVPGGSDDRPHGGSEGTGVLQIELESTGSPEVPVLPRASLFSLRLYNLCAVPVESKLSLLTGRLDYFYFGSHALPLMMNLFADDPASPRFRAIVANFLSYILYLQDRYFRCLSERGFTCGKADAEPFGRGSAASFTIDDIMVRNQSLNSMEGTHSHSGTPPGTAQRLDSPIWLDHGILRSLHQSILASREVYAQMCRFLAAGEKMSKLLHFPFERINMDLMGAFGHIARGFALHLERNTGAGERELATGIQCLRTVRLDICRGILTAALRDPSSWKIDQDLTRRILAEREMELHASGKFSHFYKDIVSHLIELNCSGDSLNNADEVTAGRRRLPGRRTPRPARGQRRSSAR